MRTPKRLRAGRGLLLDASGAVADLGVMVPIVAALVLRNGLDPATVLVGVGALYLAAGLYFRVPFPVQPIKAAAAIAIARGLHPSTLAAAGFLLGGVLFAGGLTGLSEGLTRVFTKPIVRGIQLGVGLILVRTALHLSKRPVSPAVYLAGAVVAIVLVAASWERNRLPLALIVVGGAVVWSLAVRGAHLSLATGFWHPHAAGIFRASTMWTAFVLLVIPQIPLTFGNAIVALADLERDYFGPRARRVTPTSVSLSCGIANMAAGALGGMPMCHGSGGLTAHYRAGARTARMNVLIGGGLLVLGLGFGPVAVGVLSLIPLTVLMGLLAFTGVLHALLVSDLRGFDLAVALAMGAVGFATTNLAVALAVGLVLFWAGRAVRR